MSRLVILLGLLFCYIPVKAQVLENYERNWQASELHSFLSSKNQFSLAVNVRDFPESYLKFQIPAGSTVFLEGKLWRLFERDTVLKVPVYELRSDFGKDTLQVTVINEGIGTGDYSLAVQKVLGQAINSPEVLPQSGSEENSRFVPAPVKDFYFTSLVIILFFLAVYRLVYPYLLGVLLQPLAVINAEDFSETGSLQKFFSFDILLYLFIVGMMISQSGVTAVVIFRKDWLQSWIDLEFLSLMIVWLLGSMMMLLVTILKFIAIRIISYLFDLGKSDFAHFFYLLRLIVIGFSLIILVGAYFVSNNFGSLHSVFELMLSGFFWFYVLGVVGLFLIMMNRLSFKKYHLFTYLCIVEIVPFLILSKWIMVLGQ